MGLIFNFLKRIIKLSIKLSLYLAVFAAIVVLIPNLPPRTKFSSIEQSPTQPRVGPLAPNNVLNNVEQKFKGKLLGPEAFQVKDGELYTSLATGEIVKISPGGHITFVTKLGLPCAGLSKEHICGRPLGFQIDDKSNTLYVADAYYGIWKVDLKTDKNQLLVSPRVEIENRTPKIFNSIALGKNGDFYWTDSSSDFTLNDGAIASFLDPSGRVFHYNAATNESTVLLDELWFTNGLVLSPNNEFLVIVESFRSRLLKHYVSGPKKGKTEVFVDGLPGAPDNVRLLPDGSGVLVGMYTVFDEDHPMLSRSMSTTPLVRKFLARLMLLLQMPFEYLNSIYPHVLLEDIVYHIGHFKAVKGLLPPISGLVQIDFDGNIIASYYNTDQTITSISDGIVYNDKLYLGNPHEQDFIGAVPVPPLLKVAFEPVKKSEAPKTGTKPQQPKPVDQPKSKIEEKPKTQPKPKEEEKDKLKPKVEQKPKVDEKPKQEQKPKADAKSKVETKPKVEDKKPTESVQAKASQQAQKTTPPPPKATPPPPKATTPPPKATTPPPKATTPPPKATSPPPKATTPPKATAPPAKPTTPKPEVKATPPPPTKKPEQLKKAQEAPKAPQGKVKEQIPITEEIPSDTAKPAKETLKVIKKGGVNTEIPVPNNQ